MHFPTKNIGGNFLCGKLGGGRTFPVIVFWTTPWVWQNFAIWMLFVQTCPTWITMFVLDPRESWRSAPSSNSRMSPRCHLCRTPSLPAPRRLTCLVTIFLCSSPLPHPPHSPHLPPPWRSKRVNIWYSFSTRPQPPPSHPSPWVHSSPWSYRRQGSWVLIWFHSCYCLLLLLLTFIWVDLMRRWTDNLMTRWRDLSAIPPQEFRRSTGAFASSAMKSARSCSEYICHSANKCLQG